MGKHYVHSLPNTTDSSQNVAQTEGLTQAAKHKQQSVGTLMSLW